MDFFSPCNTVLTAELQLSTCWMAAVTPTAESNNLRNLSVSKSHCNWMPIRPPWLQAPLGPHDKILFIVRPLSSLVVSCSSDNRRCLCLVTSLSPFCSLQKLRQTIRLFYEYILNRSRFCKNLLLYLSYVMFIKNSITMYGNNLSLRFRQGMPVLLHSIKWRNIK